jgi:hypothetical protein
VKRGILIALMCGGVASGEELTSARDQKVEELAHTVEIRVADGVATYKVQRTIRGGKPKPDEVAINASLPSGGAVTGLRVRAHGKWRDAALVKTPPDAENPGERPGPAMVRWLSSSSADVRVSPVLSDEPTVVEYTITAPASYDHGSWQIEYPLGTPKPKITLANPGAKITEKDWFQIEVPAPAIDTVSARYGRVIASPRHAFARLDIDVARALGTVPKKAQVVFVIDASISMKPEGIERELSVAHEILKHFEGAEFAIIPYRRAAGAVIGFQAEERFAEVVDAARAAGAFEPGNGSALDAGIAAAARALAGRKGPRRVFLFTDELVRPRFDEKAAARALPEGAIAHVVVAAPASGSSASVQRDDGAPLAPVAAGGKGMFVRVFAGPKLDVETEQLARPMHIDDFRIGGVTLDITDSLDEGMGFRLSGPVDQAPASITLDGMIWGEPFHRKLPASDAFSAASAAFVFSQGMFNELTPEEELTVAMAGHAVTPVTSYLIAEGGARPTPAFVGFGEDPGVGGYGVRGIGGTGTGRHETPMPPELQSLADPLGAACIAETAPPAGWKAVITVDTTRDEIVDVAADKGSKTATCIIEKLWALRLPARFAPHERAQYDLRFAP